MKTAIKKITLAVALIGMLCATANAVEIIDVIDASNGGAGTYFVPTDAQKYDAPYYRWAGEDWGWQHNPIADSYTTATLRISSFDVDWAPGYAGELDIISIINGVEVVLGSLGGLNNAWSYTDFDVTPYGAAIAAGLEVWMKIDENNEGWAVTLAKSVLTLDGAVAPPPQPGASVPDAGSTVGLLAVAMVSLGALRRKFTA